MNFWYSSNFAGFDGPQSACGRNELTSFSRHPRPFCFTTATNPQIGNWITPSIESVQPIAVEIRVWKFDYFTIYFYCCCSHTSPICWQPNWILNKLPYAQLGNALSSYFNCSYVMNVYSRIEINSSGMSRFQHRRQYRPVFLFIINSMSRHIRSTPIREQVALTFESFRENLML